MGKSPGEGYSRRVNDYERVAETIRYLDEHQPSQPGLEQLATHVGLSPSHFHRLFLAWAGVTPKDFLQSLTLAHARRLLQAGESVLDSSLAAGLSGPGRLHDLCLTLEAATPGELKRRGHGWQISYGFATTPFGECLLAEGPRGLCYLAFGEPGVREESVEALRTVWREAALHRDDEAATRWAAGIFRRSPESQLSPGVRAFVLGSSFQVKVWNALLRVPPGALVTYGSLAEAIGQPSAARAVGTAVGSNLLAYLIPCHRVIRGTGLLGGYRWGVTRKRAMIGWETAGRDVP